MSSIESLKEQARRHEQKEEWQKALDLYKKAIAKLEEAEQPDIALHNRVGDLNVRLGNIDGAMEQYERAIDLYMESELPNNAIAVCKKVLRNVPQRPSIHLKIGQIRASQGFLVDARASFLTYAEAMQKAGNIEAAYAALGEFADLAPDDVELRMMIAGQMEQHGHTEEAMEQLQAGYRHLVLRGREDEARAFEAKIRELDPSADIPDADTITAGGAGGFETTSLAGDDALTTFGEVELAAPTGDSPDVEVGGGFDIDVGEEATVEEDAVEEAPGGFETAGLEGGFGGDQPYGDLPGLAGDDEEGEPLPTYGLEEGEEEEAAPLPTYGLEDDDEDEDEATPLPTYGLEEDEEEAAEPLPTLGEEEPVLDAAAFGERDLGDRADQEYVEGGAEMGELDAGLGSETGAETSREGALEEAAGERRAQREGLGHEALAEQGDLDGAMAALSRLLAQDPDDLAARQRMVEYAFRTGDERKLVPAYLELAAALERGGETTKARSVYQQVLSVEPENERATAALGGTGAAPSKPVKEVASSEEYVDLGSLILDDEEDEKSTRFVVAYEEPSGDEQADFAKMLSQFKAKVAETFSSDDVRAHHDLGTAYKEMGLLDEAIAEFQQALRASADHLPTYELLGQCFLDKGESQAAARTLSRALDVPEVIEDDLLGIYYYLGRAHETLGNTQTAVEFYDKVFALDINFADVTERLRALR